LHVSIAADLDRSEVEKRLANADTRILQTYAERNLTDLIYQAWIFKIADLWGSDYADQFKQQ